MTETPADPPSYEAARDELVEVVQKLEAGGVTLEESIALWERGEQLAAICQRWLDGARARLDEVVKAHEAAAGPPGDGI
ncbi:MAG: exodeoxyribonuclease VII small subunit [Nocardioidaceae bacterium]